jgi:hypothetical protein
MTDHTKSPPSACPETQRKLTRLAEAILELANDGLMRSEIIERCGDGLLYLANLDGVARLAFDYLEQFELAQKDATQ